LIFDQRFVGFAARERFIERLLEARNGEVVFLKPVTCSSRFEPSSPSSTLPTYYNKRI